MQSLRITDVNDVVCTFDSFVYPGTALSCPSFVHVLFIPALISHFTLSLISLVSLVSLEPHIRPARRPTLIVNRGCRNTGIPGMAAASVASISGGLPPPRHLYG